MIILEKGIPPWEITHDASCDICKTKIRFLADEADEVCDGGTYHLKVKCPVCRCIIRHCVNPQYYSR